MASIQTAHTNWHSQITDHPPGVEKIHELLHPPPRCGAKTEKEMKPTKRLEILEESLKKKQQLFDRRLQDHFDTVKQTNGQPLNDKRNGRATLDKWDRQNESLRRLQDGIEKTKMAIERERGKMLHVDAAKETLPAEILALIESGALIQWRKYPNMFFVPGVDKARIIWDAKKRIVAHKFANTLTDREQRKRFADVYNPLFEIFNKTK